MSEDRGCLADGFIGAVVYRWEYMNDLRSRPKAMLIASSPVPGEVREGDDVAATWWGAAWGAWVERFLSGALGEPWR